jgi:hypothetical protein
MTGSLINSSISNNQVQQIDNIGPYATNLFLNADSLGDLSSDKIDSINY